MNYLLTVRHDERGEDVITAEAYADEYAALSECLAEHIDTKLVFACIVIMMGDGSRVMSGEMVRCVVTNDGAWRYKIPTWLKLMQAVDEAEERCMVG